MPKSGKKVRAPRSRRRHGAKDNRSCETSHLITNRRLDESVPYIPFSFTGNSGFTPGFHAKRSTRWIKGFNPACRREFDVPYIDKAGKESAFPLLKWYAHPMQIVGSQVSTSFSRMKSILVKRHGYLHFKKQLRNDAFLVASISTLTHSSWFIDRFLGMTQRKEQKTHKVVKHWSLRLDDNLRFVHSQVCSQTYWLTSRSERPRDKSSNVRMFRMDPFEEYPECPCGDIFCPYGTISFEMIPTKAQSGIRVGSSPQGLDSFFDSSSDLQMHNTRLSSQASFSE
jgi:hypothetical protein